MVPHLRFLPLILAWVGLRTIRVCSEVTVSPALWDRALVGTIFGDPRRFQQVSQCSCCFVFAPLLDFVVPEAHIERKRERAMDLSRYSQRCRRVHKLPSRATLFRCPFVELFCGCSAATHSLSLRSARAMNPLGWAAVAHGTVVRCDAQKPVA